MTVEELIEELAYLPGEWPVYVRGFEGGVNDVTLVDRAHFQRDANTRSYYGQHERSRGEDTPPPNGVELWGANRHPALD
ncbi:MAG: hypothetical protein LC749_12335 [Actinobacteria bacterium]|nr:hypothetical protein [Actinomycetota bacterium]